MFTAINSNPFCEKYEITMVLEILKLKQICINLSVTILLTLIYSIFHFIIYIPRESKMQNYFFTFIDDHLAFSKSSCIYQLSKVVLGP